MGTSGQKVTKQNKTKINTSANSKTIGANVVGTGVNQNNINNKTYEYINKGETIEIKTEEFQKLIDEKNSLIERVKELEAKIAKNKSITCQQNQSDEVQVIFETVDFNYFNKDAFKNRFNKSNVFKELFHLKNIQEELIMDGCRLFQNMLDSRGNKKSGWRIGEKRGSEPYYPPLGWIGYGLKVIGKYENDNWLGMNDNPQEWCVAYHGIGTGGGVSVCQATNSIICTGFIAGRRQAKENENDLRHPGKKVGLGVYCSPHPDFMNEYAKIITLNCKRYKVGLMMRVKPDKIRQASSNPDCWVLDGTTNQMRPYRVMIKEC